MANRRFGSGGGPPQKVGGFGQQSFQGSKMSPWQGGAAPSNMNSGGGGLLSQLANPQAQLALALTNLLQNQQSMNNNPPSLLSLPTTPGFNNQDNFGSQNRFDSRGRDFRRPEPYGKNIQNRSSNATWRDNSTRPSGSYGGAKSSGRSGSRSSFGNKDRKSPPKGGKFNRNDGKGKNKANKSGDPSKKQKDDISDENREEDANDTEKKRDWKQEKSSENDDEKNDGEDGVEGAEGADGDKKSKKPREGRYSGVPSNLLHCFVCNKSMWDGESFQNHIRGKAHKQMMDSLGQSFQITVNILRENMRLVEEKKMIELERMHRNSRNFHRQQDPQSHCNMCDLKFFGKIISHRKTEGHQRLKRFLHPKCEYCSLEFPSRMEWVDHRFTPDHLRKIKEIVDSRKEAEDGAPIEEELPEMDNDPLLEESLQTEDENPILELTDDFKDLQNRIPTYKRDREVAKNNVQPMSGYYCDICICFITNEAAAQKHLRGEKHYHSFVEAAKTQYKKQIEEENRKERENAKRKAEENEEEPSKKVKKEDGAEGTTEGDEMYDPEEACQDNEESLDNAALDEEFAEVDRLIKTVAEQEKKVDVKEEAAEGEENKEDKKAVVGNASPRGRRGGAAVRNGTGPRGKARRGGK